ncbi:S1 family peptidase [Proteus penneri]|uniref:S1 family peptidase n=1 Tax=Proteus penneri TaxID=102862 RepID=UPI001EFBCC7B|nr:serine protease [Proteus penneri]
MNPKFGDKIEYSTTRITADNDSVGTGFFVFFKGNEENQVIPVLVTNKHVIENANKISFFISVKNKEDNSVINKYGIEINNVSQLFVFYPDDDVDLCVCPIAMILNDLEEKGFIAEIFPFHEDIIFTNESQELGNISSIQEIYMTGYPSGLWDDVNNKPITRKGLTASNVKQDWQGKKRFIADIACFPGSSGSPVYIYDDGVFMDGDNAVLGERLVLLGILYAGPVINAEGEIISVQVPTDYRHMISTRLMMNLGFIIKANELLVIKNMLLRLNQ